MNTFLEFHGQYRNSTIIAVLSETDIKSLVEESRPKLSRTRKFNTSVKAQYPTNIRSGAHRRVVSKSVQAWLEDVKWPDLKQADNYVGKNYTKIINRTFWKLNQRIALATNLVTNTQTAGTLMQITNYGLGGLCEVHIDPHGLMESDETYYYLCTTLFLYLPSSPKKKSVLLYYFHNAIR